MLRQAQKTLGTLLIARFIFSVAKFISTFFSIIYLTRKKKKKKSGNKVSFGNVHLILLC